MKRSLPITMLAVLTLAAAAALPALASSAEPAPDACQATPGCYAAVFPALEMQGGRQECADGLALTAGSRGRGMPPRGLVEEWLYPISAPVLSSPRIADLDGDGVKDIILSSYDPDNPYGGGRVYAIDMSGNDLPGWPIAVTGGPFAASPAVADIDNDGDMEVVVGSWQQAYVWNHDGTSYPGWPKWTGSYASPAVADLDGDGDLEIIYPSTGNRLYVWHHDGSDYPGWPYQAPLGPYQHFGSPSVTDIDGDGELEIAAGTRQGPFTTDPFDFYVFNVDGTVADGFPLSLRAQRSAVALGDVDADGEVEIVFCDWRYAGEDNLYVCDAAGNFEPGWPIMVFCGISASTPALADLDGDGDLEIIIGGGVDTGCNGNKLFAFHHDTTPVSGWPVQLDNDGCRINSSPIVADIDGDPDQLEVVVKVTDRVFAVHADGTLVANFPYYLSDENHSGTHSPSPAVGDLDGDGDVEYVFVSCRGTIAFFDEPHAFSEDRAFWPMFKHDPHNTGYLPPAQLLGDLNCDGTLDAFDIDPFVLALTDPAGYAAAWPECDINLADINGDGVVDAFDIDPFVELLTGG